MVSQALRWTTIEFDMTKKQLDPIPPGTLLREEYLQPMAITIKALARALHVPPGRVSEIVNGKRAISADSALRLGKYFAMPPEFWLNLQRDYDLRVARRTTWRVAEPNVRTYSR